MNYVSYTNSGLFALNRIRYITEPLTAYAIEQSSSMGIAAYKDILFTEGTVELIEEMLDNNAMQQRIDGMLPKVNSRKRCNLTLTSYLNGTGVTASIGSSQEATDNNILLAAVMGGIGGGITQQVVTSSSPIHIQVATGSYTLQAGSCAAIVDPTTGYVKTARVRSFDSSTGDAYIAHPFVSFAPQAGDILQANTANFFTQDTILPLNGMFVPDATLSTGSLQFFVQGTAGTEDDKATDNWLALGLNGGFSLKTEVGELPEISYKFDGGADWIAAAGVNDFNEADYSEAVPPPLVNGTLWTAAYSTDPTVVQNGAYADVFAIEITPNVTYAPITSITGVNNILRQRRQRAVPAATGKLTMFYNNNQTFDAMLTGTLLTFELQIGNTVGNTIMISMPRCKVTSVKKVDAGGVNGLEVSFDCMEDVDAVTTPEIPYAYFPGIDFTRSALSIYTI